MALWQNTFIIIPSESLKIINEVEFDEDNLFDDSILWKERDYKISSFDSIDLIFTKAESWSESLLIWGDIHSNCFKVFTENGEVSSVSFRIDFTSEYEFVLSEIIQFCIISNFSILDIELTQIPLNLVSIKADIDSYNKSNKYIKLLNIK